jgi:hypothetical protein
VDQPASGSPVPVGERMDRLELRVGKSGLRDRGQRVTVAEGTQVREQVRHELRRRGHERGTAGVVGTAADPVLLLPQLPGMFSVPETDHKPAMEPEQRIHRDLIAGTDLADRAAHRVDVAENLFGSDLESPLTQLMRQLSAQQLPRADLQALDAGRGNRFCAQQETGQRLGIREC